MSVKVNAALQLVGLLQETNDFATQLLHHNGKMKDLFPPSSFTKTIGNHSLVERLDPLPMVVLLKIEGNCSCLRAKVAHMGGHLPGGRKCYGKHIYGHLWLFTV